jgi:hypothetical protein
VTDRAGTACGRECDLAKVPYAERRTLGDLCTAFDRSPHRHILIEREPELHDLAGDLLVDVRPARLQRELMPPGESTVPILRRHEQLASRVDLG